MTHNVPTKNIMATPIFFFQWSCNPPSCDNGSANIQKSNAMLMPAFAQPTAFTFMQVPSSTY